MNTTAEELPFVDADNDGLPDVESESDLDRLLAEIQIRTGAALGDRTKRYDVLEWAAIFDLIEYAGRWHDADGNRIPVQPDPDPDVLNLSPEAVHLQAGDEPDWYDGLGGLYVSRERSNGCVIIANPWIVGHQWRDDFEAIASDLACSARLIHMAGYHLIAASRWGMVPITMLASASRRWQWTPGEGRFWISDGGTPFNDDEIRMCVYNYSAAAMHATILGGAGLGKALFYQRPAERPGDENLDLLPGHNIWTAGQQPQTVIPKLVMKYNTPTFMREAYRWAMSLAHRIDEGNGAPVPGYVTPEEAGGKHSQAWYDQFEDGDRTKLPRFSRLGLLR